jgi:ribose 5-phosphate isomerase B
MKIALSTDHTGFEHLKHLKEYLAQLGHTCMDFGPKQYDEQDDYPDFIRPAAEAVARGEADLGIIMGGSGQGEAIVANRIKGVRCALYYGPVVAAGSVEAEGTSSTDEFDILRLSRKHNDANMLSIGIRFAPQANMKEAIRVWLETPFSDVERHARRIKKIDQLGL